MLQTLHALSSNLICYLNEKSKLSMLFHMLNYFQDKRATGSIQVILCDLMLVILSIAFMYFVKVL